jgi:phosphate transport system substrate-binding protein
MTKPNPAELNPARRRRLLRAPLAALLMAALPGVHGQTQGSRPVMIGGTGTGLAPLRRVLEPTRLGASFVPSLGSSGGLKALAAGALDIALSTRALKDQERAAGLVEREVFRTPFVWAVNAAVPATSLSLAQIANLYSGNTATWSDGQVVRLVLRPESDSDTEMVKAMTPELARAMANAAQRAGMKMAVTDDDAIGDIERIPGAIGTTTLAMVASQGRAVRVLELDGVSPAVATIANGRYAHRKVIYLMTRADAPAEVAAVVQHLASRAVTAALAPLGCLVVNVG